MKFRLLIVAAVFLASCTSQARETKSESKYDRDLYECTREATFAGAGNKQRVFDNCMKSRGYKEKQK
jgi:hypothetical protein